MTFSFLVLLKFTCLVTLFDRKLQVFKKSPNWTIFGIFNKLLSSQNVNVARFARNVDWDFFVIFKHHGVCFISISFWSRQFLVGIEGNLNLGVCDKIGLFLQCISLMSSRNSEEEEGEKWPPGDIGIIRALAAANPYGWSKLPKKGYEHYFLWDSYVDNRLSHPRLWFDTQFSSPKKLLYIWVFPIPICF